MALVNRIIGAESGGNASARNPRSSATGSGQFIDSTWLAMLAKHRPDLQGSREDLLALRLDPALSREMTAAYAADNAGLLRQAGVPVNDGTTYLAHFAGPRGAIGLLNADPAASAGSVLGDAAVRANPFLTGMSASDVIGWAGRKVGDGAPASPAAPSAPLSLAGPSSQASALPAATDTPAEDDSGAAITAFLKTLQPSNDDRAAPMLLPPRARPGLAMPRPVRFRA